MRRRAERLSATETAERLKVMVASIEEKRRKKLKHAKMKLAALAAASSSGSRLNGAALRIEGHTQNSRTAEPANSVGDGGLGKEIKETVDSLESAAWSRSPRVAALLREPPTLRPLAAGRNGSDTPSKQDSDSDYSNSEQDIEQPRSRLGPAEKLAALDFKTDEPRPSWAPCVRSAPGASPSTWGALDGRDATRTPTGNKISSTAGTKIVGTTAENETRAESARFNGVLKVPPKLPIRQTARAGTICENK